jgi:hypothetical protein
MPRMKLFDVQTPRGFSSVSLACDSACGSARPKPRIVAVRHELDRRDRLRLPHPHRHGVWCRQQRQDAISINLGPDVTGMRGRARASVEGPRSVIARPLGIHAAAGRGDPLSERDRLEAGVAAR